MSKLNFTFNNIRKDYIQMLVGRKRPSWAPIKRNLVRAPHRPGAFFINTETQERRIDVPIVIKAKKDIADLQKVKEDLAAWLVTEQPSELIFDDELDRAYLALIDGSFDAEELVNRGKGIITFICAMPYKLGPNRKIDLKLEGSRLITNILNNGSEYSDANFKIKVENPSTFIDISRKKEEETQHFRMGYPVSVEERTVEKEQLVMHDEMKTMVGWTQNGPNTDEGENTGTLKSDGDRFVIDNFGAGSKWHGGVARKSLKEPLQDFTIEAIVECWNQNSAHSMGRVEIYLLDVNSDVIAKLTMAEVHLNVASNYGEIRAGKIKEGHHIISTTGDSPWTWNDFFGRLRLTRVGNFWAADIARILPGGVYDSESYREYFDVEEKYSKNQLAQVMVHIGGWQEVKRLNASVNDIKVWKFNKTTTLEAPYIVRKGDVVEIDTADASIKINGKDAIYTKDLFGDFINIEKGMNQIEVFPSDIGQVEVTYRERYL
ncbi:phage tail family protein [Bacillus cereus]|uniref:Phage tail family protein n=2 Tax=Bacillus cereus group TaxID=86661 RepID=A0AB73UL37_BACCE|nr:distal tail protein Dit [Bacillus cereus]QHV06200.1 phage tail protein [Bacillus cereus]QHV44847.1 phage tail family protein [Bacillus cereus]